MTKSRRISLLICLLLCLLVVISPILLAQTSKVIRIGTSSPYYAYSFTKFKDQIKDELDVDIEVDISTPQDAYNKYMLEFFTRKSSCDVVMFMPSWIADFSPHLQPLKPLADKLKLDFKLADIMPIFRDIYCSWGGVLYGIPFDGDQFNLYYNKVAFESERNKQLFKSKYGYELKPPETWDQYRDIAEFFNNTDWDGDGKKEYGVGEAWKRGGYAFWWWQSRFTAYGGVFFDEQMNPLINAKASKLALENMLAVKAFTPPGTINFGYGELETAFVKGDVPMCLQWSSTGKAAMDKDVSEIVGKVGVALVPGAIINGKLNRRPPLPTGWSLGIPKYSRNGDLAARVIEFISRPVNALDIALDPKTGADPWRLSSFDVKAWETVWPQHKDYARQYVEVLKKTLELGVPDLQIPGADEYLKSFDLELSSALIGDKAPNQALSDGEKGWREITDRFGRNQQRKYWNTQYNAMKKIGIKYIPLK